MRYSPYLDFVLDDDAQVLLLVRLVHEGAAGQVGVLVLQLTVQGQTPLVLVVGQQRLQLIHLTQGRA